MLAVACCYSTLSKLTGALGAAGHLRRTCLVHANNEQGLVVILP